jgi:hypothetical protein
MEQRLSQAAKLQSSILDNHIVFFQSSSISLWLQVLKFYWQPERSQDSPADPLLGEADWIVALGMGNNTTMKAVHFHQCFCPQEVQAPIGEASFSLKVHERGSRTISLALAPYMSKKGQISQLWSIAFHYPQV